MKHELIVMVKDPRPGLVKTRLGRGIGHVAATWWFRHQVKRLLARLEDPRWELLLAVAPDRAVTSRAFPAHLPRLPQGRGDLGDRMGRMLRRAGKTCVIGADVPDITREEIARAFRVLGRQGAVFGPAEDGGYWLIGLGSRVPHRLFEGVRWSTEHALADTVATLGGLSVGYVATLHDVDEVGDL